MFKYFQGETANEIWTKAYNSVIDSAIEDSRAGKMKEVLHAALSLSNPTQRWISYKYPPISIGYALAELIWVLSGSDDANVINFWNPNLPKYAGDYLNYPGAYGNRIINRYDVNQLEKVYETLYNHPESRQAVILIWDPRIDLPANCGKPNNSDIPCNICSMIKVREGKLEWTQIMRSNDLILGFPYNIVLFTSLQEILASWLNLDIGSYNHISDSLHIYENQFERIRVGNTDIYNHESLSIAHSDFYSVIDLIYKKMQYISANPLLSGKELISIANTDTGYIEYNNILKIICAYAANKIHAIKERDEIVSGCTNAAYKMLWNKWLKKYSGGILDE